MAYDLEILGAIQEILDERPDLLGDDADVLAQWLSTTSRDDPEAVRQTANRALATLQQHPQARTLVNSKLGTSGGIPKTLREYDPLPSPGEEIPPGTLMVCPEDPGHYRRWLRQKGQPLFCPEHGVALVPADSLPGEG